MSVKGLLTIKDIAKMANVNHSTVSRALNNHPYISTDTKERIFKIAQQYKYTPNTVARSLKNRNTQTLGLVLHTITNPFWSEFLECLEDVIYNKAQDFTLFFSGQKKDKESAYIDLLMKRKIDGAIITLMPTNEPELFVKSLERLKDKKFPFVLMFGDAGIECNCVSFNHYKGQYMLTEHLIKMGHRNICYAYGSMTAIPNAEKVHGYKQALMDNNIDFNEDLMFITDMKEVTKSVDKILNMNPRPTAVAVPDDNMAIFYWREMTRRGIRIPEDIALVGFYDIKYLTYLNLPITTVRIPVDVLSQNSVDLLLENVKNPDMKYKKIVIEPELIVRESCGFKKVV
ncbi:MAG: hypothetical protein A2252_00755 [Elusimicrobia bacterium RIFOXYA2_FULL_39_19]|nr:MAG: hypothetical protein A2252_00755 [Elusimicrobia bacterium RIFOXYA2_FULL_39_19]